MAKDPRARVTFYGLYETGYFQDATYNLLRTNAWDQINNSTTLVEGYSGRDAGGATRMTNLGLIYNIGTIGAGESATVTYYYVFKGIPSDEVDPIRPTISSATGPGTVCLGNPVSLSAQAEGGVGTLTYKWYSSADGSTTNATEVSSDQNPTFINLALGDHYYYVIATDGNGESSDPSTPVKVTVSNTGDCLDSDGDGVPDVIDLDSDNDGILDSVEGPISLYDTAFRLYDPVKYTYDESFRIWNLYANGIPGTRVTVTACNGNILTATIPASGQYKFTLTDDETPAIVNYTQQPRGVRANDYVSVSADSPITLYQEVVTHATSAQDITPVYPKSAWGKKYTVAFNTNTNEGGIVIFSADNNNRVILRDKNNVIKAQFTLQDGDRYMTDQSILDFNGYTIEATYNVGVMVSNSLACGLYNSSACDNTVQFIFPDRLLGTKFLSKNFSYPANLIIVPTENATTIKVNNVVKATINKNTNYIYTQPIDAAEVIETSNPVQILTVAPSSSDQSIATAHDITKATLGPTPFFIPSNMKTVNAINIYVKTADTGKMRFNGNPITGWTAFSADSKYSYVRIFSNANPNFGLVAGTLITISSVNNDVPFIADWLGIGNFVSEATAISLGGYDLASDNPKFSSYKDTDGDGIPDYLDLDSDNDGCLDAIEGGDNVKLNQLVPAGGTVTVGIGSTAQNHNLCGVADGSCVDAQGVPIIVNPGGAADEDRLQGQGIGDSANAAVQSPDCTTANCTKPSTATGTSIETKTGISIQQNRDTWPEDIPNGWLALEAKTKGFVITRVADETLISEPKEGMLIYDESAKCVKLYDGTKWGCLEKNCD